MERSKNFIFIDNGYDSIKCAQYSTNIFHEFDYFNIPNILINNMIYDKFFNFKKSDINDYLKAFRND